MKFNVIKNKLLQKTKRIFFFLKKELKLQKKINYRVYKDLSNDELLIDLKEGVKSEWAFSTIFLLSYKNKIYEKEIYYSHLTLLSLLKNYSKDFNSVLDIGSHAGNCSDIFKFLGKKVVRCEHLEQYEAEYKSDFIYTNFNQKFDCIWASQVLEHQKNVGLFLDKCFDLLNEDGILAITVPDRSQNDFLEMGHCIAFSPLLLIYNLVLAGFDCSNVKFKIYDDNIGLILRKKYNHIDRKLSMASTMSPNQTDFNETVELNNKIFNISDLTSKEIFDFFPQNFPKEIKVDHVTHINLNSINWDKSI